MGLLKEFREFAVKGNVIDMAVGIIIGAAFGKIVSSLVNNIIMPPLTYAMSGVNFRDLEYLIAPAELDAAGNVVNQKVAIEYGTFLQVCLDFLFVAMAVFMIIKLINKTKRKAEDPKNTEVATPQDIKLLSEIRDLLKSKN